MQALDDKTNADKELRHLARLLYVGQLVELFRQCESCKANSANVDIGNKG